MTSHSGLAVLIADNASPTLDSLPNVTLNENANQQTVNLSGISAGAGENQPLRVTASSTNTTLIANPSVTYNSPNSVGSIKFTPSTNQTGSTTITVTVEDGGLDGNLGTPGDNATFSQSFTVVVNDGNANPTLNSLPNLTVAENATTQTVSLSGISAGPGENQPLRVTAVSSDGALIPDPTITYTSPNSTGILRFKPAANRHGSATITVTVEDGGSDNNLGTAGDNATFSRSFFVTVQADNAPPTLNPISDLTINENAAQQTVSFNGVTAGAGETQPLRITTASSQPSLIPSVAVNYTSPETTGSLNFTPAANQSGTATITVTVEDGGNDGNLSTAADNATFTRTFDVIVNGDNAIPTLNPIDDLVLRENAPLQRITLSGVSAGVGEFQPLRITASSSNTTLIDPVDVRRTEVSFQDAQIFNAGNTTHGATAGDFDGDGNLDAAVGNQRSNFVTVMFGKGDGTFAAGNSFGMGREIYDVAAADLNGDGLDDLIASNFEDNLISVRLGRSNRTFSSSVSFASGNGSSGHPSTGVWELVAKDMNNDGKIDIVAGNQRNDFVSILLGNGAGGFGSPIKSAKLGAGGFSGSLYGLTVEDIDQDGIQDVAVTITGQDAVKILRGQGNGTLNLVKTLSVGDQPFEVAAGDFDANGKVDLAVVQRLTTSTIVKPIWNLGNNDFNVAEGIVFPQVGGWAITSGDVDADGDDDLAFGGPSFGGVINYLSSNGDRTFSHVDTLTIDATATFDTEDLHFVDFNTDGFLDVVASKNKYGSHGGIAVFIANPSSYQLEFGPKPNQIGVTDITVTVEDSGNDLNLATSGDNASFERSFRVTVNPENAPPTLDSLSDLTVLENSPLLNVALTGITAGEGESQALRVIATSSNTALIPNPAVTYTSPQATGSLSFTPAPNQLGAATISVTVEDAGKDGQLSTTADNATVTKSFTVNIASPNFAEVGRTLELRPQQANQRVQSRATASGYQFTLSSGVWSGIDSSRVSGNGTAVLTVTTAGRDYFNAIKIDDFAANVGVDFTDSGTHHYSETFFIDLDRLDAGDINFTGNTRFLGNFSLQAITTREIIVSGASTAVSTVDGNLLLWSNQQQTRRTDVAQGISIFSATVEVLGAGELSLLGRSGGSATNSGGNKYGVQIVNGKASGGITGSLTTITGTAGVGTGDYNHGVLLWDTLSGDPSPMITSRGGDVTVVGRGGGAGASNQNVGVDIHRGGSISAGGTGSLLVQGFGGLTTGNRNFGVQITGKNNQGAGSSIYTNGGDVRIEGQGGGAGEESRDNYGVRVYHHASIQTTGTGKVAVAGRGGETGGIYNFGVFLDGHGGGGEIRSVDGEITVVAQGGGVGETSRNNYGVDVWRGGSIHSSGSGSISVSGTGAVGAVGHHHGVIIHGISADGKRSQISASGGDVTVTGQGGGTGDAASNFGVFVSSNGLISSTGSGNVTVTGTSGETGGGNQIGVAVNGEFANAQITSVHGKVTVVGRSLGNGTSSYGEGVELYKGGEISSTGQGEVHVEGSSAEGSGPGNRGVFLFDVSNTGQPSRIISSGGKVTVHGTGGQGAGENSANREGILVKNGARISSPGDMRIIGQGGLSSQSGNHGVFVDRESADGIPSAIISTGGLLEIIGNGGGTGNALYNYGVIAWRGGLIQGAPNAATKIIGTGGTSAGSHNLGVVVEGSSPTNVLSTIRSMGGSLEITGTGGGTLNASNNYGVIVNQGGLIQGSSSAPTEITGTGGNSEGDVNHGVVVLGVSSTDVPSKITSTGGPLTIGGHGAGTGDSSWNHGVLVKDKAEINGPSEAELTVIGRGGGTTGASTRNYGVVVNNGSAIQSPGGGLISVDGTGGNGTAGYNYGVLVTAASPAGDRSRIQSAGGNVSVTGQGGGNGDSLWDFGVILFSHGLISSTGSGDVTVTGTSGRTGGHNQIGVGVNGKAAPAQITTVDGKVTVVGRSLGNGLSGSDDGVELYTGGEISSTGMGDVQVLGFGGQGSGWGNRGVLLYGVADSGQPSRIISAGGKISVAGTGGGVEGSGDSTGVTLQDGGTIRGPAEVNVNGNGGLGTGSNHHGVFVRGESAGGVPSTITSTGGALQVIGVGGGSGNSGNNLGICVWLGGLIQGASNATTVLQGTGGASLGARNDGVRIDDISTANRPSTVTSAGGPITITGQGGGSGTSNDNHGVWVVRGGVLAGPTSNPLIVSGTGGSPSGDQNMGIHVSHTRGDIRSTITSSGGDVTLVGEAGGSGASAFNRGVAVWNGGLVAAGGSGAVSVAGTGGNGDGAFNLGVSVIGTNGDAQITSSGGDVLVQGFGNGTANSIHNRGVEVLHGGVISAGQTGKLTVEGTGGNGSGGYDIGVLVMGTNPTNQSATISSADGEIKITGQGGGSEDAPNNYGIHFWNGGQLVGPANIHLTGHGGNTRGAFNNGIRIGAYSKPAKVSSTGGSIVLEGTGGGIAESVDSSNNYGVAIVQGAEVSVPSGNGRITLSGRGGPGGGDWNRGVYVVDQAENGSISTVTTNAGEIRIEGVGGQTPTSNGNYGIDIALDARLDSGGDMTLVGFGSDPNSISPYGLLIRDPNTTLRASKQILIDALIGVDNVATDFSATETAWGGGSWQAEISGLTPETEYDQLDIEGKVELGGISLIGHYTFPNGGSVILIDNDGDDPIVGRLYDLTEGSGWVNEGDVVSFNGALLRVSYQGGDGNDLELTSLNVPPTLDPLSDLQIAEDSGSTTINLTGISAGNTESQPLRVTAVSSNPALIPDPTVAYDWPSDSGSLTLVLQPGQSGATTLVVTVEDGGFDGDLSTLGDNASFTRTLNVIINPVNDAPTLDGINGLMIDEDATEQNVNLTGISAGGGETQPIQVTATSGNAGLIPDPTVTYTSANATGSLAFTPVTDQSGIATITVTVVDGGLDGDLATPGDNASFARTFDVVVNPVNDVPTLDAISDLTIDEDAVEQTVNLTGITAGGRETQPLRVTATSSNTGLIADPTVTYTSADVTGHLSFATMPDQSGTATITVTVEDGGLDGDLATPGD
ncbi:MAG: FG-GAP-like repeat-containing protein, partial [Rubripirellula sp.]